jgi:hypothetical protein
MAYTKNPASQTYDTKRMSLLFNPLQRSGALLNKDAKLVNMMVDVYQSPDSEYSKAFVKSRPGLSLAYSTTAGTARGIYYWTVSGVGYAISVVGTKVYSNSTELQTLTTSTGDVGFTEFVDSTGTVKLVMVDGTKGYVFTSPTTASTEITSTDFPTPHVPHPIFLDGYLFVAKADTQDIYNSDLDDPAVWTAGNYMSAEMFPDKIVALTKNNNYIYAVGTSSVEYLYDAAEATGSPLGRHDSAVQQFGTVAPGSVVPTDNEVIMIGETGNGGHTVWTIDGFKAKEVGVPSIRSVFRAEGANLASARAHCVRVAGQKLYIINLTSVTLVYSFDTQMWSFWTSGTDGSTAFIGRHATDGPNGTPYCQDKSTGAIYIISEDVFTDNGTGFLCQVVTPKFDFDSLNRKTMSRFALVGDWPTTSGTGNNVSVEWTDDDYTTWSTPRTLSFDLDFPFLTRLGIFRRRAFRISYSQPYRLRLEGIEVDLNKGSQ